MKANDTKPTSPYKTFLRLVWRMRKADKLYYEIKTPMALRAAKQLETEVDRWLEAAGIEAEKIKQMAFNSEKPN